MKYLSVCSGIEAASVAWNSLGWEPVAFSEIEPFPCSVLAHHYPNTPNWGDMTKWRDWPRETIDLLVGGTPCQSFSNAGQRRGMDDPRGKLALAFSGIADKYRPRWIVWENVPGVLSSGGGRDFGSFIGSLVELGYGLSWRVLDAQYFGLAQRRKRVFVVGYLGDWRHSTAVLFESQGLCGHLEKGRKKGQDSPAPAGEGTNGNDCGLIWSASDQVNAERLINKAGTLNCNHVQRGGWIAKAFYPSEVRLTGTAGLHDKARTLTSQTKRGDTEPHAVMAFPAQMSGTQAAASENISCSLQSRNPTAVAIMGTDMWNGLITGNISMTIKANQGNPAVNHPTVVQDMQVRRLTPRECERLQGFPDDWTLIPWRGKPADQCPDGPRYKAIGNSMAVPVMRWIGERINMILNMED